MAGSFRDPLVGRDILFGGVAGALVALLMCLAQLAPAWFGRPVALPIYPFMDAFSGVRQALSVLFNLQSAAVVSPLIVMLLILVVRIVVRRQWLSVGIVFSLLASMEVLSGPTNLPAVPFVALVWALLIAVITRFGLFPSILTFYFANILLCFYLPSDLSIWYAPRFIFIQIFLIVLVFYGFSRTVHGQRLLGKDII